MKYYSDKIMEVPKIKRIFGVIISIVLLMWSAISSCKQPIKEKEYVISIIVKEKSAFTGSSLKTENEVIKCKTDIEAYKKGLNSFYAIKLTGVMLANEGIKAMREAESFVVYNKEGVDVSTLIDPTEAARLDAELFARVEKEKKQVK